MRPTTAATPPTYASIRIDSLRAASELTAACCIHHWVQAGLEMTWSQHTLWCLLLLAHHCMPHLPWAVPECAHSSQQAQPQNRVHWVGRGLLCTASVAQHHTCRMSPLVASAADPDSC